MGAWGVGVFSNDFGADVRDEFRELIADGLSATEASSRMIAETGVGDDPDEHDFWLALAATQHRSGHVDERVVTRALQIIDSESELDRWNVRDRGRRRAVLDSLRGELVSAPPAPKTFRKRALVSTALVEGQHVVATFDDLQVLLRVVGVHQDKGGRFPVAVALKWGGSGRQLRKAHRLKPILNVYGSPNVRKALGFLLADSDPSDLTILDATSNRRTPVERWHTQWVITWRELPDWFRSTGVPTSPD